MELNLNIQPTLEQLFEVTIDLSSTPDMPKSDYLTLSNALLQEVHEAWSGLANTTKMGLIGIAAGLVRHAHDSGELDLLITSVHESEAMH